jgi:hypothetical protein
MYTFPEEHLMFAAFVRQSSTSSVGEVEDSSGRGVVHRS